jgi:septal ring factor EnvC (AmiA/AmiB activator)
MTAPLMLLALLCASEPAGGARAEGESGAPKPDETSENRRPEQRSAARPPDVDGLVVPPPETIPQRPALDIRRHLMPEASIIDAMGELDERLHASATEREALTATLEAVKRDLVWREAASQASAKRLSLLEASLMRRVALVRGLERSDTPLTWLGRTPRLTWQDLVARTGALQWSRGRVRAEQLTLEALRALVASFDADLTRRQLNRAHIEGRLAVLEARTTWDTDELAALKKAVVEQAGYYAAYARDMEAISTPLGALIADAVTKVPVRPRLFLGDGYPRLTTPLRHGDMIASYGPRAYLGVRSTWRGTHWALSEDGLKDPRRHGVRAAYWGYVLWTGWFKGLGQVVILDHTRGVTTIYGHLADVAVKVGERVAPGHRLGTVGETGSFFGRRLYFELRVDGEPENPLPWLK